jgi:high-affinity iron transporter
MLVSPQTFATVRRHNLIGNPGAARGIFNAFMITLREGIEAFLIVAITLAYLRKTGRESLRRAVHLGIFIAVVASYLASLLFAQAENKPLWEGVLALATAVLVGTFSVQVIRTSKYLRRNIEGRIEQAALREGCGPQ